MTPTEDHADSLAELHALRAEMKEWALGIRCLFAALNVLPLYYCTRVLLATPRFASIFEDMLGSSQKLPQLTRLVFQWFMPLLGALWLLTALSIFLIFNLKRARHVWVTAALSVLLLIATGHLTATALFDPLIVVIQSLSGG